MVTYPHLKQMKAVRFGDATLSDVALIVDNHEFHLHKMASVFYYDKLLAFQILANNSDYFKKLFYEGMNAVTFF